MHLWSCRFLGLGSSGPQRSKVFGHWGSGYGSSENRGFPYFGALIIRILLVRVLYWGPLFSETPI